ncbi:MAG: hypothetical protein IJ087_00295 [Eggerthellaceae bacterium]|nr:hypothetical protein [Eggerthellaceae bacterium]
MTRNDFIRKITSRKFLLSLAAFIAVFCTGVAGVMPPEWCAVGMALSAGIYAACEAYVDGKSAGASQTISTTSVSASATSQKVVEKAIVPDSKEAA